MNKFKPVEIIVILFCLIIILYAFIVLVMYSMNNENVITYSCIPIINLTSFEKDYKCFEEKDFNFSDNFTFYIINTYEDIFNRTEVYLNNYSSLKKIIYIKNG